MFDEDAAGGSQDIGAAVAHGPTIVSRWLFVRTGLYTWKGGGRVFHRDGPTVDLYFHFYPTSRGWRIYDVTSNGVSAVDELRAKFHNNLFER